MEFYFLVLIQIKVTHSTTKSAGFQSLSPGIKHTLALDFLGNPVTCYWDSG